MRNARLLVPILTLLAVTPTAPAHAEGEAMAGFAALEAGALGANVLYTTDAALEGRAHRLRRGHRVAQVILMIPAVVQGAVFVGLSAPDIRQKTFIVCTLTDPTCTPGPAGYSGQVDGTSLALTVVGGVQAAWSAALLVQGIVALARGDEKPAHPPKLAFMPSTLPGGGGIVAAGRF